MTDKPFETRAERRARLTAEEAATAAAAAPAAESIVPVPELLAENSAPTAATDSESNTVPAVEPAKPSDQPLPAPVAPPVARRRKRSVGAAITGVIGELLITAGVLVGMFVLWQWWWTDVVAEREVAQTLAELPWEPPPPVVAEVVLERHDDPPVLAVPEEGEVFGTMYIPRFGSDWVAPVAHGIGLSDVLDQGWVGHFPGTAMPGELGNFSTAAHRRGWGRMFNQIEELQVGDPIVIRTADTWYVYRMTESLVVYPNQVEVVAPIPGLKAGDILPELTVRYITLTSCHPIGSARQRYVVHGEFDFWMPVSDGIPQLLIDAGVFDPPEGAD